MLVGLKQGYAEAPLEHCSALGKQQRKKPVPEKDTVVSSKEGNNHTVQMRCVVMTTAVARQGRENTFSKQRSTQRPRADVLDWGRESTMLT